MCAPTVKVPTLPCTVSTVYIQFEDACDESVLVSDFPATKLLNALTICLSGLLWGRDDSIAFGLHKIGEGRAACSRSGIWDVHEEGWDMWACLAPEGLFIVGQILLGTTTYFNCL